MEEQPTCIPLTQPCPHALVAADLAVEKTFAIFGVDVNDPKQVKEFQASLWFSDRLRKISDKSVTAVVVATVVFLLSALGLGIKQKIMGGP